MPLSHRSFSHTVRCGGFSLLELMVAMGISVLLLAGVISIFASSRTAYENTDRSSRIQENGRLALDIITRHIRASGFVGCARQPTYVSTSLSSATTLQWNFLDGPVRGFQATGAGAWTPAMDASIASPTDGSDVLVLRVPAREATPLQLTTDMASAAADLVVTPGATNGVQDNDIAIAYSCEAQSVFQVRTFTAGTGTITHGIGGTTTGVPIYPGNASGTLNYTYRRDVTHVLPVETVVYYVTASTSPALPAGTTSLWRRVALNAPEELIEGVEQMQLQFGVDTNGDVIVDQYQTANLISNWQRVISVRVALLVRSLEEYGLDTDQRTYQLIDVPVAAAADRRMREVFTATAAIRNRVRVN